MNAKPDEEPKVFDVRKSKFPPSATSKPIIVGHHPMMPDPMLHSRPISPPVHVGEPPAAANPVGASEVQAKPPVPAMYQTTMQPGQTISPEAATPKVAETVVNPPAGSYSPSLEDLKVKLPAGAAAHNGSRAGRIVLLISVPIILLVAIYLYSK